MDREEIFALLDDMKDHFEHMASVLGCDGIWNVRDYLTYEKRIYAIRLAIKELTRQQQIKILDWLDKDVGCMGIANRRRERQQDFETTAKKDMDVFSVLLANKGKVCGKCGSGELFLSFSRTKVTLKCSNMLCIGALPDGLAVPCLQKCGVVDLQKQNLSPAIDEEGLPDCSAETIVEARYRYWRGESKPKQNPFYTSEWDR